MNQNNTDFQNKLAWGGEAERSVACWLKTRGFAVIPSYDYTGANGDKAPKMTTINKGYPVPDLDVAKEGRRLWVEVKRYTYPPLNRAHNCKVHGITKRLYDSYLEVEIITGCEVWLAIEEEQGNRLLMAQLSKLKPLFCLCGCQKGQRCKADIKNGVYFDVSQFTIHKSTLQKQEGQTNENSINTRTR